MVDSVRLLLVPVVWLLVSVTVLFPHPLCRVWVVVVDWLWPVVLERVVSLDRVRDPSWAQAGPPSATEIEIAASAAAAF